MRDWYEAGLHRQCSAHQSEKIHQLVSAHALILCKIGRNARPHFQFKDLAYNDYNLPGWLDYLEVSSSRNVYTEKMALIVALTPRSCDNITQIIC
jgi:hypothetical protein